MDINLPRKWRGIVYVLVAAVMAALIGFDVASEAQLAEAIDIAAKAVSLVALLLARANLSPE